MLPDSGAIPDKRLLRAAFDRAAADYDRHAALQRDVADRLLERLDLVRLEPARVADVGAGTGYATRALARRYRKARIYALDLAPAMVVRARRQAPRLFSRQSFFCGDADALPLPAASMDLLFSNLALQWCSDLSRTIAELTRALAPGGLLLFSTFGPDTLAELRESWREVDKSTHVNHFFDMHDIGDIMLAAGLKDVVVDVDRVIRTYPDVHTLMRALKAIGAHNVTQGRPRQMTGRSRLARLVAAYERYRTHTGLPATYEVVYGHAWAPPTPGSVTIPVETLAVEGPRRLPPRP